MVVIIGEMESGRNCNDMCGMIEKKGNDNVAVKTYDV